MTLWDEVAQTVQAHSAHADIQVALGNAAFLFEKARASTSTNGDRGWSPEVVEAPLDPDGAARVRGALVAFVRSHPDDLNCVSAYWALSKLNDRSLRDLYIWALTYYLERDPQALFQVLIALSDIGEAVWLDGRGSGALDVERNQAAARAYLTHAQLHPSGS